uniref:Uncharacterized protein AlNc14C108G6294 n=1 Tax=Albugo laibachii Nc14 TaxID=890382 RepID=F0WI87_9STRA|nr:conserved hypothetical protein [Albugo laibachii Nc14]|eukprot:CCA20966.1 conserved hypothetical protein [Albugo laibachii Nc14]
MTVVAAPGVLKQLQHSYKIREKIGAIKVAREVGEREAAKQCSIPRRSLRDRLAQASEYDEFDGNLKKTTLGGQGRHEVMPFAQELVNFMQDRRRNDKRLAVWHGFLQQTASESKQSCIEIEGVKRKSSEAFWNENSAVDPDGIINVDERGIYYDMPPKKIWNIVGEQPKVDVSQRHSARLTAVLGIKAEEQKLPIMFIVKGTPGGYIKKRTAFVPQEARL